MHGRALAHLAVKKNGKRNKDKILDELHVFALSNQFE